MNDAEQALISVKTTQVDDVSVLNIERVWFGGTWISDFNISFHLQGICVGMLRKHKLKIKYTIKYE